MTNLIAYLVVSIMTNVIHDSVQVGAHQIPCPEGRPGCCVLHYAPDYSSTDYYEVERVQQITELCWEAEGQKGRSWVATKDLTMKRRLVHQVNQMVTNDWEKMDPMEHQLQWLSSTNLVIPWCTNTVLTPASISNCLFLSGVMR